MARRRRPAGGTSERHPSFCRLKVGTGEPGPGITKVVEVSMPLSDEERRRLEQLDRELSADDPQLARKLRSGLACSPNLIGPAGL